MRARAVFVTPKLDDFQLDPGACYCPGYLTYSHYNYLRPGLISSIKRNRFEVALRMAADFFGKTGVIDMGCADGILLPSLAKFFPHVVGVDPHEPSMATAQKLVSHARLQNVQLVHNAGMSFEELKRRLEGRSFGVMFLLETLEHIGQTPGTMYDDKLRFLDEMFELLTPEGVIIVSVPKMVGPAFLVKYAAQCALRLHHEPFTFAELFRAGLLRDTSRLEHKWNGGHIGFSDLKLQQKLAQNYRIVHQEDLVATRMWMISRQR